MYRESWVEINLDALKKNIKHIQKKSNKDLICVIKANGYGSGDQYIVQTAIECGITFFAVSSLDEALVLRNEGCKEKILILGYVNPRDIKLCKLHNLSTTIISLDWLKEVVKNDCEGLLVHLKIDTGMNRIGIKNVNECKEAVQLCLASGILPEGVFTHFACSDDLENEMTVRQYQLFVDYVKALNYQFTYIHCDNSDALVLLDEDFTNRGRLGISMYGINSHDHTLDPVFSLYSTIACIKEVEKGETISYGATYETSSNEIIATLPIGYADGWLRSNQGRLVYIEGEFAPLVGRICMDQCMIKTNKYYQVGTKVELFGNHISVQDVAKDLKTIPYEILTNLSERLVRVYCKDNKVIAESNARLERSKK